MNCRMLLPVRCFSCSKFLQQTGFLLVNSAARTQQALQQSDSRYCCRTVFLILRTNDDNDENDSRESIKSLDPNTREYFSNARGLLTVNNQCCCCLPADGSGCYQRFPLHLRHRAETKTAANQKQLLSCGSPSRWTKSNAS